MLPRGDVHNGNRNDIARGVFMDKRRIFILLLCATFMFCLFAGRLFWIQVLGAESYSAHDIDLVESSVLQREKAMTLDSGRGDFYDRDMRPLTGEQIYSLAVFPVRADSSDHERQMRRLAEILNVPEAEWISFVSGLKQPALWRPKNESVPYRLTERQIREMESLRLPGVKVLPYTLRYPDSYAARHLIGFISQDPERMREWYGSRLDSGVATLSSPIGASGLEKSFDAFLQGAGKTSISLFTDGRQTPLAGLDARVVRPSNPYYPLKVVTTLDLPIQRNIEALLQQLGMSQGSVVVLDAANGDVVSMASRPQYDPYHVHPERGDWENRALKAIAPGSVFKTVVAAASLEEGLASPQETFMCSGELGKYGLSCWKKDGHGAITFQEAFAVSCNVAFAQAAERLTAEQLQKYADRLGLARKVGWASSASAPGKVFQQFDGEEAGQLFASATPKQDGGVIAQTAIGQRDVRMTPLQAANLVVTLLNGGEAKRPRVVKEIRDRQGGLIMAFDEQELAADDERGISLSTSRTLVEWMKAVVAEGTGKELQRAKWLLAGKSGTAEMTINGQPRVNQWFIGFGPSDKPKYAVSVVVERVAPDSGNKALALFRGVMDILAAAS